MKKYIIISIIGIMLTGCNNGNSIITSYQNNPLEIDIAKDSQENLEDVRISRIKSKLNTLKNIQASSVVVSDNVAIVGIELREDIDDKELMELKKEISNFIKEVDKNIYHVSVTSTLSIVDKLKNVEDME